MGCLISTTTDEGNENQIDPDHDQVEYTETYDPANMSVSRDSTMADYQFTGKKPRGSFKLQTNMKRAIRLSTIKDEIENENSEQQTHDTIALPHKRVIFISIAQLNACIDDIPDYIVSESIFCFKAQRSWFWPRNIMEHRESQHSLRHKIALNDKFLNVLKEKDEKKLVLWLEGDKTWTQISEELTQIEDIYYKEVEDAYERGNIDADDTALNNNNNNTERRRYAPLQLDTSWWLNEFEDAHTMDRSMYCDSADVVVEELIACKLKFNPTMELLYQSNPSLIPMRGFDFEMYLNHHYAEKEMNKEDTTLIMRDADNNNKATVNDIVPALTPYSPPFTLHNDNVANMPAIDISDKVSSGSNHNSNKVNITPAPSNRPHAVKLTSNSSEPFAIEGSMVYIADAKQFEFDIDDAYDEEERDRNGREKERNPHQIEILNLESNEI